MYDSIIIGSGPAGLTAAVYLRRAALEVLVCEKDYMGMGAMSVTDKIDNYPGFLGISGYDLGEKFRNHADSLGAKFLTAKALTISKENDLWKVSFENHEDILSKTIIYSAGTSYRKLDVKGNNLKGISYCAVCDGAFYKDKTVAVIGGGDTAFGDALYLSNFAKKIYIIARRNVFRANASLQENVKSKDNIEIITDSKVTEIKGEKRISSVILNGEKELTLDGLFLAIGSTPNTEIVKDVVSLDENGYIIAGEDTRTNIKGFFAAGDVRTTHLRQIVTAAADGANAAYSAEKFIRENI